jgi:capsid assembly protease
MQYPFIAARLFNTPLLIHPQKLDAIIAGLGPRILGGAVDMPEASDAHALLPAELFSTRKGARGDMGYTITDGVAVIHASGALVHRSRMEGSSTYLLGYNELAMQVEDAMSNPDVHAVLQVWDSPGGEVAGAFEYSDRISALRGQKPMWSIADNLAASAAYLGGSAFEQFAITQTAYAGSIGVVMRHVDFSRKLANDGVQVTHIYAGDHKVDANPYEPLSRGVQQDLQGEIDGLYTMFVDAVARSRSMKPEAVRATQAQVFRGQAAVQIGLADRVATTDQLIAELAAKRARSFPVGQTARSSANDKGVSMSGITTGGQQAATPAAASAAPTFTQADIDSARAEGRSAGAAAERERIQAVEAQLLPGHEALIASLKFDGASTGGDAAMAVNAAERSLRTAQAQAAAAEANKPVGAAALASITAVLPSAAEQAAAAAAASAEDKTQPVEDRCQATWEKDAAVRGEFSSLAAYTAYTRATEEGRAKVFART